MPFITILKRGYGLAHLLQVAEEAIGPTANPSLFLKSSSARNGIGTGVDDVRDVVVVIITNGVERRLDCSVNKGQEGGCVFFLVDC